MTRSERTATRRTAAIGGLMLLTGGVLAVPVIAQSVPVEEFRTSVPELGGYTAEALSSPISIQLFEPVIPVPAGPGEPHGEMHGSYSRATLGTGPSSRGLGSAIWPGATAGDGLSAFDPNIPPYPFKADAKYPDGPYEAIGESGDPQQDRGSSDIDTGMFAYARGIDVYGESNGGGEMIPALFEAGSTKTVSTTTIVDGVVIAETIATMSDVAIAGGIVTMDGTQTRLIARSNGEVAETDGVYEISGLEIMGQGFELTEEGLVATGPAGDPVVIPLGFGNEIDLSDAIGVTVEAAPIVEETDGASGSRSTRGVMITLDTTPLRQAAGFVPLATVIGAIPDVPEANVVPCDQRPPQMNQLPCFSNPVTALKANLFTLASLQPKVRFLIGGGQVSTSASLPFNFTPPPLPDLPPPPSVNTGGGFVPSAPTFVSPPTQTSTPTQPAPQVAPPATTPGPSQQFVALQVPAGISRGVGMGAALLSLGGIALLGRAGKRLTMSAIYGGAETASVGAAAVPDLRAFARGETP